MESQWREEHSRREGSRCGSTLGRAWAGREFELYFENGRRNIGWDSESGGGEGILRANGRTICSQVSIGVLEFTAWTPGIFYQVCILLLPQM